MSTFKLLATAAGLVLAVGCGSDSNNTPNNEAGPSGDGSSVTIPDGGGPTFDSNGTTPDQGVVPTPDQGVVPTETSCPQAVQCLNGCAEGDQACQSNCVAAASADAKTKLAAINTCLQGAASGSCAASCADQNSTDCQNCVQAACKAEIDACLGGGGPAQAGFGDVCDLAAPACPSGLQCIGVQGGTEGQGFCTKQCTNQGMPCEGSPDGTQSACILGTQGSADTFCAFLCAVSGQNFQCPSTMTCGPEQPAGSGQKPCVP